MWGRGVSENKIHGMHMHEDMEKHVLLCASLKNVQLQFYLPAQSFAISGELRSKSGRGKMSLNNLDFISRQGTPLQRFETEQAAIRDEWETLDEGKEESRRALRVGLEQHGVLNGEKGVSLRGNREFRLSLCVWEDSECPRAADVHG